MLPLRQRIQFIISKSFCKSSHLQLPKFIHSTRKPKSNSLVAAICDCFRRGWNWDTLSKQFNSIRLNDSLVENVLLELKEPVDAKRALGFFHWSAHHKSYQHNLCSYSVTIHILVRARLLVDARALIESVLEKHIGDDSRFSVVDSLLDTYNVADSIPLVFDLLVQTYSKMRLFEVAFDVCCYLEQRGFSLSLISFNTLIHVVTKSDRNDLVWRIYQHMLENIRYPNEVTIRTLISALCKGGQLQTYVDMLDRIHGKRCSPMVIVNTSLILRIIQEERIEEGMVLLKRMLRKNMIHDTIAYSLIVYAKVKGNLESALVVYEEMLKRGFSANSFVYTTFIGAYCEYGKIEEANCLMQEMENAGLKPYDETFNLLIEGCAKAKRIEESLSYCEQMMSRKLLPGCSAFNEMIRRLCECGNAKQANGMLTLALDKGFSPNEITYSHLIGGYAKEGEIQEVLKLYYEMEYKSISPTLPAYTSLISSLCQCGKLEEADKYFKIMKSHSLVPGVDIYESLVGIHLEKGNKAKALHLCEEMVSEGLKPSTSYLCSASTCRG